MSDILRLIVALLLLATGLAAYFLVLGALFPQRFKKTKSMIQSMPGRSFGIGMVNFLFFAVIAILLFSLADKAGPFVKVILTIPALVITSLLLILLGFGLAAMTALLGERIFPDPITWKQTVSGTFCLSLACAVPFAGWFLLLPYTGFVGVGAFILSFFQREPSA